MSIDTTIFECKFMVSGRSKQTNKHTHTRAQCSHASVGLAQARPNHCNSGTLCAGMEREYVVYTQPNTKSMVDHLSFFKPTRPNLLEIGQTRHQSTPLYLYIQNIKLVCNSGTLFAGLEWENVVYSQLNTKSIILCMVDRLSFFKPKRPNLLEIGQTRHQSTPLYLYIQTGF